MIIMKNPLILLPALAMLTTASLACDLKVESAWIRVAPGNATAMAGYAVLGNAGSKPLGVAGAQSAAFARVELHESLVENGMARMRPIGSLELAPGARVEFAPGGKHFMLMQPKAALRSGDVVAVRIKDSTGCETIADFKVSSMGPPAAAGSAAHQH